MSDIDLSGTGYEAVVECGDTHKDGGCLNDNNEVS